MPQIRSNAHHMHTSNNHDHQRTNRLVEIIRNSSSQEEMTVTVESDQDESARQQLKESLLQLASETKRGFVATKSQQDILSGYIQDLNKLNPTKEPLSSYYTNKNDNENDGPNISGKWTLVYTNAPDITSLDPTTSVLPTIPSAKLGRIGQECSAEQSTIKNVIEWTRPDWVGSVLNRLDSLSGNALLGGDGNGSASGDGRVLQKVVCEAEADPMDPMIMNLQLVGLELEGQTPSSSSSSSGNTLPTPSDIIQNGPAALLSQSPVSLRGPLKAPFGKFEVLYLDDEMRIIRTNQGFYAVNLREEVGWF